MAVVVTVETGSLVENANSYVSIATIDAWVLTNPHDTSWESLTEAQKNGYAVMACRVLNEQMDWDGRQINSDQALDLPRSGLTDKNGNYIDNDEIPVEVQNAQSEFARLLVITDSTGDSDLAGLSELSIGPIKMKADNSSTPSVLPDAVWQMVRAFGKKSIQKGGSRVIRK